MITVNPLRLAAIAIVIFACACAKQETTEKFDPGRDAASDVASAVMLAKAQGKRVIVNVGGE